MSLQWLDHLLGRINAPHEELNNNRIHVVISPHVESLLLPKGFKPAGNLKWVRDQYLPIRQVFTFTKMKGGVMIPGWGISLDFVPHISGNKIGWHRSSTAARLDLGIWGDQASFGLPYTRGEQAFRQRCSDVISRTVENAEAFWVRCNTVTDLPAMVEALKVELADKPLTFYNFTQHPIAAAFVFARTGATDQASIEFEQHVADSARPEVTEKLRKLLLLENAGHHS